MCFIYLRVPQKDIIDLFVFIRLWLSDLKIKTRYF